MAVLALLYVWVKFTFTMKQENLFQVAGTKSIISLILIVRLCNYRVIQQELNVEDKIVTARDHKDIIWLENVESTYAVEFLS